MTKKRRRSEPRVVPAPAPILPGAAPPPPNRVLSVILQPGEEVGWIWTFGPDGGSYVSGYTIINPRRPSLK